MRLGTFEAAFNCWLYNSLVSEEVGCRYAGGEMCGNFLRLFSFGDEPFCLAPPKLSPEPLNCPPAFVNHFGGVTSSLQNCTDLKSTCTSTWYTTSSRKCFSGKWLTCSCLLSVKSLHHTYTWQCWDSLKSSTLCTSIPVYSSSNIMLTHCLFFFLEIVSPCQHDLRMLDRCLVLFPIVQSPPDYRSSMPAQPTGI